MANVSIQVICPTCGRHQTLRKFSTEPLPVRWFDDAIDYRYNEFLLEIESVGGQGRGIKGKDIKSKVGFETTGRLTLAQAWAEPAHRDRVSALYRSQKRLVDYLESIGVR